MTFDAEDAPYKFFALEAGTNCYCGNTLEHDLLTAYGQCNICCISNKRQQCGGKNRVELWNNIDYRPSKTLTPSATPPVVAPPDISAPAADAYPWSPHTGVPENPDQPYPWSPKRPLYVS
jgi:hypothetical protein